MADAAVLEIVRQYLRNIAGQGIRPPMGVLFGSHASGRATPVSYTHLTLPTN